MADDIWLVGDTYINVQQERPATEEEIADLKARHAQEAIEDEKRLKTRFVEDILWHKKYDPIFIRYFEHDTEDDFDPNDIADIVPRDDAHLVYLLSTRIFDLAPDDYYKNEPSNVEEFRAYVATHEGFKRDLGEMRAAFPDHYDDAVEGFINQIHDT